MIRQAFLFLTLSLPAASAQVVAPRFEYQDCNANGIADLQDILLGTSEDCQGDGIPDECQLAEPFTYSYDDGGMSGSLGTTQRHVAWMTQHTVIPGQEIITSIELGWGDIPAGSPAFLALWSDPDGDGDPADAELLMSHVANAVYPQTGFVVEVDVPDTYVGPAGTTFFVGSYGEFEPFPENYPAGLDENTGVYKSWWITSDSPIDPDDLSSGAIVDYGPLGLYCPCDGDWMIRALACGGGHCLESEDINTNGIPDECEDCNGNGRPDDLDIASGILTDCDGDQVPDQCALIDCDGNGHADLCQAATPQGLAGEYYSNRFLDGTPFPRIDPLIAFDFDADPPFSGLFPGDHYSVRWTGSITSGPAGTYLFALDHRDGVRLWIDGQLVIEDWNEGGGYDTGLIDLAASTEHYIRLEYYGQDGDTIELLWEPPGGTLATVPSTALQPILDRDDDGIPDTCQITDCNGNGVEDLLDIAMGLSSDCDGNSIPDDCQPCEDCDRNGLLDSCELLLGQGLQAQYFVSEGADNKFAQRVATQIDPNIDFDWAGGPPLPGMPSDNFGVRWTGTLVTPPTAGVYRFHVQSDDGVRMRLDGQLLVDEWHPSSGNIYTVDVSLAASSEHLFELDYYEDGGDARIFCRWTVPGQPEVPVPSTAFRVDTDVDGDGFPDLCNADCDLNGIPDVQDIALGIQTDLDGTCVPDICEFGAGYWRFEEPGGSAALDSTGNGLDGSLNGLRERSSDVPVDTVGGQPNESSLDLNWQSISSSGLVEVPDTAGQLTSPSFTLEAWVKLDSIGGSQADDRQWLFMKKIPSTQDSTIDYGLMVQGADIGPTGRDMVFRYGDGVEVRNVFSALRIEDLEWHFVSISRDAERNLLRFGLDGVFQEVSLIKEENPNSGPLVIGAHQNGLGIQNHFLRGSIDEVRFSRTYLPEELLLDALR